LFVLLILVELLTISGYGV